MPEDVAVEKSGLEDPCFLSWGLLGMEADLRKPANKLKWVWLKIKQEGTAGFSPYLPGFHFGYLILTHSQMALAKTDYPPTN